MSKTIRLNAEDWLGLGLVAVVGSGMAVCRELAIVRRMTAGLCAAANAPSICAPRAAVLWGQYQQAFGWAALLCGIAGCALGRRWPGVLAVAVGIVAVVNDDAATGIVGAALGLITWLGLVTGRYDGVTAL